MIDYDKLDIAELLKNEGSVSEEDFMMEVESILKEFFVARFARDGKRLKIRLFGGQEIMLSAETINEPLN